MIQRSGISALGNLSQFATGSDDRNMTGRKTIVWETATSEDLENGYREMAADEEAEAEALEWCEALIGDVGDDEW